jgi:uncharacterized protein (TIGR02598 family)
MVFEQSIPKSFVGSSITSPTPGDCSDLPLPQVGTRSKSRGFSLVEVAVALGIVGFALVAILGVMPIGLSASRTASDLTVTSLVIQRLTSLVYQTGYSNAAALEGTYYYFDDGGRPLASTSSSQAPSSAIYTASIQKPSQSSGNNSLMDSSTVVLLQVNVVSDPGHRLVGTPSTTLPVDLQSRAITTSVFLANQGN